MYIRLGAAHALSHLLHTQCRDIAPELGSLAESNAALEKVVELAEHLQKETGKKVLWGTAQLFKHPRFAHGGATSAPPPLQPSSRSPVCRVTLLHLELHRRNKDGSRCSSRMKQACDIPQFPRFLGHDQDSPRLRVRCGMAE